MNIVTLIDPASPLRNILLEQQAEWRRRLFRPPDPDAPTGPPPTFDVTPIERLRERAPVSLFDPTQTPMAEPARDPSAQARTGPPEIGPVPSSTDPKEVPRSDPPIRDPARDATVPPRLDLRL